MTARKYDIIGDVHGHAEVLRRLLRAMGYPDGDGVFRHSERQVIFVGDFVDRGPEQREVLHIAKSMCDAGAALGVMGNHEFNALGWAEADGNGGFLRPHSQNNKEQHEEFLRQVARARRLTRKHLHGFEAYRSGSICLDCVLYTHAGTRQLSKCSSRI
jgi:hypothetical protein